MIKKQMQKKSSKIDRWQGIMDERTAQLVKTTDELKEAVKELHCNVDKKFEELTTCVDQKFQRHNDFHTNKEKKYRTYFLIVGAIAVGGCLANPDSLKFFVSILTRFIGIL